MTEPKPKQQYNTDETVTATALVNIPKPNGQGVTIVVSPQMARLVSEIQKRVNQAQLQQIERIATIDLYTLRLGAIIAFE